MLGKFLVGLSVLLFAVAVIVLPNVHTGSMAAVAQYIEFGIPSILLVLGLLHLKLDRIEKLLSERK